MRFTLSALLAVTAVFGLACLAIINVNDLVELLLLLMEGSLAFVAVCVAVAWQGPAKYFARAYAVVALFMSWSYVDGLDRLVRSLYEIVTGKAAPPGPLNAGYLESLSEYATYDQFHTACSSALNILLAIIAGYVAHVLYLASRSRTPK